MDKPIFISGLRKSGTSMIKGLLDNHPELFIYPPNEVHLFRYSHHNGIVRDKNKYESDPEKLKSIIADTEFITRLNDESFSYSTDKVDVETFKKEINETNVSGIGDIYDALYRAMVAASDQPDGGRFVSKTVLETEFFPELHEIFPGMKFVYVLRNPYGHFNSARNSLRADRSSEKSPKFGNIQHPYPFIGSKIRRMKGSYYFMEKYQELYPDKFYLLIYDKVLENPEREMKQLANFLNVEFDESMLVPTLCGVPWGGNSMHEDQFKGISTKPLTHWKKHITDSEIRLINEFFSEIIKRYNFEFIESNRSMIRRLHASEWKPTTYLANRIILKWGIESADTF